MPSTRRPLRAQSGNRESRTLSRQAFFGSSSNHIEASISRPLIQNDNLCKPRSPSLTTGQQKSAALQGDQTPSLSGHTNTKATKRPK